MCDYPTRFSRVIKPKLRKKTQSYDCGMLKCFTQTTKSNRPPLTTSVDNPEVSGLSHFNAIGERVTRGSLSPLSCTLKTTNVYPITARAARPIEPATRNLCHCPLTVKVPSDLRSKSNRFLPLTTSALMGDGPSLPPSKIAGT